MNIELTQVVFCSNIYSVQGFLFFTNDYIIWCDEE